MRDMERGWFLSLNPQVDLRTERLRPGLAVVHHFREKAIGAEGHQEEVGPKL